MALIEEVHRLHQALEIIATAEVDKGQPCDPLQLIARAALDFPKD